MALGRKTGGRVKGSVNKQTKEVKQTIIEAFEKLGGVKGFVAWGKENPTDSKADPRMIWPDTFPSVGRPCHPWGASPPEDRRKDIDNLLSVLRLKCLTTSLRRRENEDEPR